MAKYNVHAGHCPQGKGASGAVGFLKESVEDRIVKNEMIRLLKAEGHTAYDCTCDVNTTKSGCLAKIVAKCNAHAVDADASIHLNSGRNDSKGDGDTGGVEVFVYSKSSKVYDMAERICKEISKELAQTGEFFGLQIYGNSMEPRICDGDVVIVRQQNDAESGDIVIATVNGDEATCKRLRKYRDGIELVSNNPSYDPMFFSNKEILSKPVKIIGKVIELRGKF